MSSKWEYGEPITWRNVGRAVEYAFPAIVVADDDDLVVLYQPHATIAKRMKGDRGSVSGQGTSSQLAPASWDGEYEDYVYSGPNVLRAYRQGDGFSIIRSVSNDLTSVSGWYINIELPWRRTAIGFDSRDLVLDLRRRDERWIWEDEDELEWAVEHGTISEKEENFARSSAKLALEAAESNSGAFGIQWASYLPEHDWPLPAICSDWRFTA
jgi:hypothetical protein